MRVLLVLFTLALVAPARAQPQEALTVSNLPTFLSSFQKRLEPIEAACAELAVAKLPLRKEDDQDVGKEAEESCERVVEDMRHTVPPLTAMPRDMVLALTLYLQTERLVSELYDLSQMAYDRGYENAAKRLADLLPPLEGDRDRLENFVLNLVSERQERLRQLEEKNCELLRELDRLRTRTPSRKKPRSGS